jgi:hypothetical protein
VLVSAVRAASEALACVGVWAEVSEVVCGGAAGGLFGLLLRDIKNATSANPNSAASTPTIKVFCWLLLRISPYFTTPAV